MPETCPLCQYEAKNEFALGVHIKKHCEVVKGKMPDNSPSPPPPTKHTKATTAEANPEKQKGQGTTLYPANYRKRKPEETSVAAESMDFKDNTETRKRKANDGAGGDKEEGKPYIYAYQYEQRPIPPEETNILIKHFCAVCGKVWSLSKYCLENHILNCQYAGVLCEDLAAFQAHWKGLKRRAIAEKEAEDREKRDLWRANMRAKYASRQARAQHQFLTRLSQQRKETAIRRAVNSITAEWDREEAKRKPVAEHRARKALNKFKQSLVSKAVKNKDNLPQAYFMEAAGVISEPGNSQW